MVAGTVAFGFSFCLENAENTLENADMRNTLCIFSNMLEPCRLHPLYLFKVSIFVCPYNPLPNIFWEPVVAKPSDFVQDSSAKNNSVMLTSVSWGAVWPRDWS